MLSEQLKELTTVLQSEAAAYAELLQLSEKKQRILIEGKAPELEEILKQEELLTSRVGSLEKRRTELHEQLAAHFGISAQELVLTRLVSLVPEPHARELAQLKQDLNRTLDRLGKLNRQNAQLIRQSLEYINFSLNLLIGADGSPVYNGQKGRKKDGGSRLLDRSI